MGVSKKTIATAKTAEKGKADPVLTSLVEEDKTAWYRKPNLRTLYFLLFPACMGIELTSGFDSQMINALQIVNPWKSCEWMRMGRSRAFEAVS
jgi:hypothetical protein